MQRHLVSIAVAGVSLACQTYVPTSLDVVPMGATVRAVITPGAQERFGRLFAVKGSTLSGQLVERNGEQVTFYVASVPAGEGFRGRPLYEQVELARPDVLRVDMRRVDAMRTGLVVGLAAGAAAVIVVKAFNIGEQKGGPGGDGTIPPESRTGWSFRIPVRVP